MRSPLPPSSFSPDQAQLHYPKTRQRQWCPLRPLRQRLLPHHLRVGEGVVTLQFPGSRQRGRERQPHALEQPVLHHQARDGLAEGKRIDKVSASH